MKEYQLFKYINSAPIILLRWMIFLLCLTLIFILRNNTAWLDTVLYIYTLFIISELYIHIGINNAKPAKTVWQTEKSEDTLDLGVKRNLESSDIKKYIQSIKNKPAQKFFQEKVGEPLDATIEVPKEKLLAEAYLLAKSSNSMYITEMTIFAAYVNLQEETGKYLEKNNLATGDTPYLLFWTHKRYPPKIETTTGMPLVGGGVFDFFVYGWNAELEKYAYDFTSQAVKWGASAHAVGRVDEYDLLVKSLLKGKNNNVLLIGDPGVGKTSLVAFLAKESYNARIPGHLARTRIYGLQLDRLLAGADTPGEIEKRLTTLLTEIAHTGNVLVYIANIELLFGGGGQTTDLSGLMYDYLKSAKIQVIGTTTPGEYETVIKSHDAHVALFENITLREPDTREARFMIFESITHLERAYKTTFTYKAILTALEYADDYQTNLVLPGSAMVLLEDAASTAHVEKKKSITEVQIIEALQKKTKIVLKNPDREEKDKLLHLEDYLKKMVVGQDAALVAVSSAMRRARSGFRDENRPIASFLFLGPTGVGKTQVAKALAQVYFENEENMIRLDMSEYNTPDAGKKLLGEMPGEDHVKSLITKVKEHPFALILLDEFEKADPEVRDMFLQVLDDARLTNNKGETASFENTIIIATSNAGSEFIRQNSQDPDIGKKLQEYILEKHIFTPELLNRFTEVVTFQPLQRDQMKDIALRTLMYTSEDLKKNGIELTVDPLAVDKIASEGFDPDFGARNMQRYIKNHVEDILAEAMLSDRVAKGGKVTLTLDSVGNFVIK